MRFANDVFSRITISEAHGRAASLMVKGIRASLRFGTGPWVASVGKHIREVIDHVTGNVAETITVAAEYDAYYYQVKRVQAALSAGGREAAFPNPGPCRKRRRYAVLHGLESTVSQMI